MQLGMEGTALTPVFGRRGRVLSSKLACSAYIACSRPSRATFFFFKKEEEEGEKGEEKEQVEKRRRRNFSLPKGRNLVNILTLCSSFRPADQWRMEAQ